jgi:hypothetical protein
VTVSGFIAAPYLAICLFVVYRNDGHTFVTNSNIHTLTNDKPEDYNALEIPLLFSKLSFSNPVEKQPTD